jgi:hypothetical protein
LAVGPAVDAANCPAVSRARDFSGRDAASLTKYEAFTFWRRSAHSEFNPETNSQQNGGASLASFRE